MRMIYLFISVFFLYSCSENNPYELEKDSLYFELSEMDDEELQKKYDELKSNIQTEKQKFRDKSNAETEKYIVFVLTDSVFHFWYDTPWDFNGITQKPRQGNIACGYFVTTTLLHTGFQLERVKLAQQAASIIIRTLCEKESIKTFTNGNLKGLKKFMDQSKDGIYIIGLDNHVGFLHKKDSTVFMIHADYINDKVCREEMMSCKAILNSKFHMIGNVSGNKKILDAWRKDEKILMED